jgi:predicted TIM-barrel fold metal-dependent hydrolase
MDTDGVDEAIVYPTAGLTLYSLDDRPLVASLLADYNDWLAEFCAGGAGRLRGIGALLTDEPAAAVAEARRCRELGHVGLLVPLYDDRDEDFGDPAWDPLWAVAQELSMPVGFHAFVRGPGGRATINEPAMDALVNRPARVQRALLSAILGGAFARFPGLRMVSAENEAGWAASMLERADESFERGRFEGGPERRRPSEVFAGHVFVTVLFDRSALHARKVIGVGNLMWSSDYPHNMSTWPHSADHVAGWVDDAGVGDSDLAAILAANASGLYPAPG